MPPAERLEHWTKTRKLMWLALLLWAGVGFLIPALPGVLNTIVTLGFPLGFYMAAQGSIIAFVVLLFWFARRQNAIDEEQGVAED